MATDPLAAFIWGSGGAKLSPEQVAERRRMAGELAAKEIPGLGHWAASLNQGLTGLLGGRERRIADEAETLGREGFQSAWDSAFGGGQTALIDPVAAALMGGSSASAPASMPTGDNAAYIRQGMIQRGLPEHVADAFLLNMQDESGLNPGINEAAPTVPGSRGGYGLYQLTGPRRRAYEAFAQQKGIPLDSVDGQLDFLMGELAGSESAAAKSILSAPDTGSAAAAIVNNFLRPAESHRARRANSYMGGSYKLPNRTSPVGGQVDPAMLMAQPDQMGAAVSPNMQMPAGGAEQAIAQALSQPQQAPQQAQAPMATQAPAMGGGQPSMQQLMALAGNEWGSGAQQSIIQSLIGQQMQQQQQANDPLRQLQLQKAELELQQMLNPGAPKPIEVGGVLLDGASFQPIFDSRSDNGGFTLSPGQQRFDAQGNPIASGQAEPGFTQLSPEQAASSNLDPSKGWQVGPDGRVYEIGGGGVNVTVGGEGQRMGAVPAGMAAVPDPTNPSGFRMEMIPGGPAAMEAENAAATAQRGDALAGRTANLVREDIDRIKSIVNDAPWFNPAVGFGADLAQAVSGSNATNVAALSKTVLANIGFDRLQQMREASPTGGALGAISDRELGTLQAVMGNLEQSQSVDQFTYNLDRLGSLYDELLQKASAYPNAKGYGFEESAAPKSNADYNATTPPEGWSGDAALWQFMSPEDRALW